MGGMGLIFTPVLVRHLLGPKARSKFLFTGMANCSQIYIAISEPKEGIRT